MKKIIRKINKFLFKEKKKHHIIFSLVSVLLIIVFTANLFFANNQTALGATYTFTQTSWAGGITANNAVHPTNQTSWNQFSASTTGMTTANSGADLQLLAVASSTIHTSDTDFSAGTLGASTTISGSGSGASIRLMSVVSATGGTISYSGNYTIHTFTSSGTFTPLASGYVEYLVVAGGGGGGSGGSGASGGGGGGGFRTGQVAVTGGSPLTVIVGGGGGSSVNGSNSVFSTITSIGGGAAVFGGGSATGTGNDGGSGGGGSLKDGGGVSLGGLGTSGQGNNGGTGNHSIGIDASGGGGGGAGSVGSNASLDTGGNGGVGQISSISGVSVVYAGGGGGGADVTPGSASGGGGIGGNGFAGSGMANTGGGGGGTRNGGSGGSGGSGIVIIRYLAIEDTSGVFISSIIDYTASSTFTTLAYTATTPTNTTLTVDVRAGNTSTPDGTWTSWQTGIASGGSISALSGNRYAQYRANLSRTDTSVSPSLDDITINYTQYATSTDLTSSPYNTSDAANILSSIQWTESLLAGTDVKFQLRTAPNSAGSPGTWTSWLGPDGTSATHFTDPTGGETMPNAFISGGDDQWVQYKVFMTSAGANTPTLSDVTFTYVVNAAPSIQNITASQGSDGKVNISYEVKDTDTSSGTANPGYITPSFEYWNGSSWTAISSGLATGSVSNKAVNQSSFTSYNTTWTASTTIGSQYYSTAKIRVTASDNEAANNTANDQSAEFVIDTTIPVSTSVLVKATTTPAVISLSASDNSSIQMKVGLSSDLSDASWESYSASKTVSLATNPDTVYARFKDAYGNESATISASSQTTPSNTMIQDTSNMNASPDELRFFLAWDVVADPALGFGSYHVYRSTDGSSWSLLSSVGTRTTNYYVDSAPSASTTYYYKVAVVDASGNTSYLSSVLTGVANGIQDGSEGGGGTSNTAPTISSVSSANTTTQSSVVSWTTDALSNSVVGYCASPCSDYTTNQSTVSSYLTSHSVALTSLSPNTTYNYKVFSTDSSSNTASSSGYTLTTNSGPSISAVAVTNVNNVSADITWNTNIAASGYVIYSTTTPPSGGEAGWATRNTSRTVSLSFLTGGTKYYFYVKSQDIDNNWAYDYNISSGTTTYYSFTTPLDVTAPTISSVASTTQRTAAIITWSTDEEADSKIIYGTTTAYGSATALDTALTATHAVSLSSLAPGTTYYYKAVSSDGSGNQATSSGYTLLTETLSLTGITAVTPTVTTAVISWTTSDNATSQAEYSTFSDLSSSTSYPSSPSDSVTSHSISLSSLSQGTTYYYRVHSITSGLGTTTSQIYQFTTGDTTAPTVSSVSAGSIKDTSAVISWITDEPANTQVQYGTASGSYTTSTTLNSTLTRNHSVTLTGLSFQSIYYYRVLSTDGNSNATTSSESSFTTLEEQINKSQQTVTTTTVISGGGGGGGSTGVPLAEVNNLKLELGAIKKERDDYKKENDDLKGKIIGVNLTGESLSPTEVISLVIDKFTEITDNLTESALTIQDQTAYQTQAEKLEKDIIPAVTSLRQLAKLVPPPKLKTEPKLEIGPTEAIVSWLTDKLATSVVYFSESKDYSEKTPDTYTNSAEDSKNYVEDHKITLKGLSPLTDYHYRLMSESEAGAKAYSSDFTFTTKPETPVISSARAEKSSDTSILVTWRTNIPTNSAVIYTPIIAGKPDVKKSKSEGSPEFDKDHSITVSRLEPSTIYSLEISSSDHFGNVALKKLDSMSIAKDETPPIVSQVRNESSILSGSSNKVQAIFYWKTDEPSTTKVIFEKGQAIPGAEDTFSEKSAPNEELTMNHIAVITSWEPGQLYRFKVVSVDAFGNEAKSKTFTVIAPRQKATVVDLIIDNFSDTFDWTKKIGF